MKVVILAGGFGSRLSEETHIKPKPMVEIGDKPILWHIMKIFSAHGLNDFVICCGYKGYYIKDYFANYFLRGCDVAFDLKENKMRLLNNGIEPWTVTLIDTGQDTMTGGRLKRIRDYVSEGTFCCTYGDGVSDIDIRRLIAFHREQKVLATLTAVQPPGRFGAISLEREQTKIANFREKPDGDGGWINGGFFVLEPKALDYIDGDSTVWEQAPLEMLARDGKLAAYKHYGFWQNMDSLRDKFVLEGLWVKENPPWKIW